MISTVTTSTVSTVSTVATAMGGSLALVGILVLLAILIQKEIATASEGERAQRLGQALNVGLVPLLIAFVLIVGSKLAEVLR